MSTFTYVEDAIKWWVGVPLVEMHLFDRDGRYFAINVGRHEAVELTESLYQCCAFLKSESNAKISEESLLSLVNMGLVKDIRRVASDLVSDVDEIAPDTIALFVSQKCNLRCTYCFGVDGSYGDSSVMDDSVGALAVRRLFEWSAGNQVRILYFGGEPMMNFSLVKSTAELALQLGQQYGVAVQFVMITNGTYLNLENTAWMTGKNFDVQVSVDGTEEVHNQQRPMLSGKGSYKQTLNGIQHLKNANISTRVHAVVSPDVSPIEVYQGLKKLAVKDISVKPSCPVRLKGDGDVAAWDYKLWNAFNETELRQAVKTRSHPPKGRISDYLALFLRVERRRYYCGVGKSFVAVDVAGGIYPCHRFVGDQKWKIGEVQTGLDEKAKSSYIGLTTDNMPQCSTCWARNLCGGGCLYEHASRTGDFLQPSLEFCSEVRDAVERAAVVSVDISPDQGSWVQASFPSESSPKGAFE
jgi:uncharacterized protein